MKLDGFLTTVISPPAVSLWPWLLTPKSNQHIYEHKYICDENWGKFPSLVFTARLHVMQRTVLLSQFCPSVCLSDACIVTKRNSLIICQYLKTVQNRDSSGLSTPTGVARNCPLLPEILAESDPPPCETGRFQPRVLAVLEQLMPNHCKLGRG